MTAGDKDSIIASLEVSGIGEVPPGPEEATPKENWMPETPQYGFFPKEETHHGIWRKAGPLGGLGVFQVVNALVHISIGAYLASAGKNLHLVTQKSWYPFWGATSFLCSGVLLITMERRRKMKFKTLTMVMSITDCFFALCGVFVLTKDLFLESPFNSPLWRPYPTLKVHLQKLELGLLIFSSLEVIASICAMILLCRIDLSSEVRNDFPVSTLHPEITFVPSTPPPSYKEVIRDDKRKKEAP